MAESSQADARQGATTPDVTARLDVGGANPETIAAGEAALDNAPHAASSPGPRGVGDTSYPAVDPIEAALADAIARASAERRWETVTALATEAQARRLARAGANVVALPRTSRGRYIAV